MICLANLAALKRCQIIPMALFNIFVILKPEISKTAQSIQIAITSVALSLSFWYVVLSTCLSLRYFWYLPCKVITFSNARDSYSRNFGIILDRINCSPDFSYLFCSIFPSLGLNVYKVSINIICYVIFCCSNCYCSTFSNSSLILSVHPLISETRSP